MDVRLNQILQSAEKFVRDKSDTKEGKANSATQNTSTVNSGSDFAVSLSAQFHNIQSRLGELQRQLSREQARVGLLEESKSEPEALKTAQFEANPLFPELLSGSFSKDQVLLATQTSIRSLLLELKKKEVEGENIFSLGMIMAPEEFVNKFGQIPATSLKPISENTVKRLLGG